MFNKILLNLAAVLLVILVMKSQACKRYSKCEKERAVSLVKTRCGMTGVYVPQCEKDGRYSLIQCKPSGYCCCADPFTGSLSGCVQLPQKPQCCRVKDCEKRRSDALKLVKLGLQGVFVPRCQEDGTYSPIQTPLANMFCCADFCNGSLSECVIGPKRPECAKKEFSNCQFKRAVGLTRNKYCRFIGGYIPQCEKDGSYSSVQSSPTGYSCCAEPECGKQSDCVRAPEVPHCSK